MMKKILVIIATHGDEKIGGEIVKMLLQSSCKNDFDYIIGNPRAYEKNTRFIDVDLNRNYPGSIFSDCYEVKRAAINMQKIRGYDYIIDLHEASQGEDDFIIVPKKTFPKKIPWNIIDMEKVLLWPDPTGPLGGVVENAVELEFGTKSRDRKMVISKGARIVEKFITDVNSNQLIENKKQVVYLVYGKIKVKDGMNLEKENVLQDFQKIMYRGEFFYPLLVNQYLKEGILCYKMQKEV
ncbi:MAG: hypothetical protein CR972_03770 [Candidatus Moraniibacteriota bacterium]|nr:MAG: hypothetical protein CR972_03770 [Candidatus Moranbacteria bacterium]